MAIRHLVYKENLAAYALDALDNADAYALEAHLRTCDSCRADLEAYRGVGANLLAALSPKAPPASLRRGLQNRVAAHQRRRSWGISWSFSQLAAAGAVAVMVGLNLFSILEVRAVRQQLVEQEAQSISARTAIAMLAYPGTQAIAFDQNGVAGSLLVDRQRDLLAVFAWHLPPAPAGKTYQLWLIDARGNRTSGGFLTPEPEYPFVAVVIKCPAPLGSFTGFGVTAEPIGGSPGPTGPKVFGAEF
jgi:anti-sigma-K factor RskA